MVIYMFFLSHYHKFVFNYHLDFFICPCPLHLCHPSLSKHLKDRGGSMCVLDHCHSGSRVSDSKLWHALGCGCRAALWDVRLYVTLV